MKINQFFIDYNSKISSLHQDVAFPEKAKKYKFYVFCMDESAIEQYIRKLK